jgi:hypothetical protein
VVYAADIGVQYRNVRSPATTNPNRIGDQSEFGKIMGIAKKTTAAARRARRSSGIVSIVFMV